MSPDPPLEPLICKRCRNAGVRVILYRLKRGEWKDSMLCGNCVKLVATPDDLHPPHEAPHPRLEREGWGSP